MEWTVIGTGIGVIGFTYTFLRNFKIDVNKKIDRLETRLDQQDDRMFWLMTGKKLSEAILEEKIKKEEKKGKNV
jgi:hypothetical protein